MNDAEFGPDDFKLTSTGRLTRHDDEIQPGDVVAVENFRLEVSPRMLSALGIHPDMTQQEVNDRMVEAFKQAALDAGIGLGPKEEG